MASSKKKRTAEQLDFDEDWSPEADTLRRRMLLFQCLVPLIRDKDFFESNPQVLPLHSILSVTLEDFIRITDSEPRLWPSHSRVKMVSHLLGTWAS